MKAIYKLNLDCGRYGNLYGIFVADKEYVDTLIDSGIEVYFGEVLGKHSDVYGEIEETDIKLVTDDPIAIEIFERYDLSSGYNPFDEYATDFDYEEIGLSSDDDLYVYDIIEKMIENKKEL